MKLSFLPYDESDIALIRSAIRKSSREYELAAGDAETAKDGELLISIPHPIYYLSGDDLLKEKEMLTPDLLGRQYLLLQGESIIGSAEIITVYENENSVKLNYGNYFSSLALAIEEIEKQDLEGEFSFSLLKIPSIYLMAVWLSSPRQNYFVPFGIIPSGYKALRLYTQNDFFRPARKLSLDNLQF